MKSTISEFIPLSIPHLGGNEWKYIKQCLDTNWVSSVGSFVNDFEKAIADYTSSPFAVATVNGTSALHISLVIAGVKREDYVIVPNITFIASANSVIYAGAKPLFMDVDPENWQMNLDLLERFLTEETEQRGEDLYYKKDGKRIKAIMPVHVLGNMCDMKRLLTIAHNYSLELIEDSTEALGSYYQKQHAGSFGSLGCFSFNGNKIITTGGGGMIVCKDETQAKRAKHLTTQAKADPIAYMHDEIGYNYRMVNILAAMGMAQLEQLPDFLQIRKRNAKLYKSLLEKEEQLSFQKISERVDANHWLFTLRSPLKAEIMKKLMAHKIQTRPLWVPMNQLPMFENCPYISTHDYSKTVHMEAFSLPSSSSLTEAQVEYICTLIKSCL